jgi:hypothetical protein
LELASLIFSILRRGRERISKEKEEKRRRKREENGHVVDSLRFRVGVVAESGGVVDGDLRVKGNGEKEQEARERKETHADRSRDLFLDAVGDGSDDA